VQTAQSGQLTFDLGNAAGIRTPLLFQVDDRLQSVLRTLREVSHRVRHCLDLPLKPLLPRRTRLQLLFVTNHGANALVQIRNRGVEHLNVGPPRLIGFQLLPSSLGLDRLNCAAEVTLCGLDHSRVGIGTPKIRLHRRQVLAQMLDLSGLGLYHLHLLLQTLLQYRDRGLVALALLVQPADHLLDLRDFHASSLLCTSADHPKRGIHERHQSPPYPGPPVL